MVPLLEKHAKVGEFYTQMRVNMPISEFYLIFCGFLPHPF